MKIWEKIKERYHLKIMDSNIQKAVEVFKQGGVVIFPTDTVWGIGCVLNNKESVKKLYEIRKRPREKALIVLVNSIEMAQEYLQPINGGVKKNILEKYWPQSLTVILPCRKEKVPEIVRSGGKTLAVRITNHPILSEIITKLNMPILAPSANFAGEKTPAKFSDIDKNLLGLVDYVLKGESLGRKPSTIIDCSQKPWKIIRQGEVVVEL